MTQLARTRAGYALALVAIFAAPIQAADQPLPTETFAVVGNVTLTAADYRAAFGAAAREKFYHSKPPEAEVAAYQRVVGDDLIKRVLVVEEAKRRGIAPDPKFLKERMERFEARRKHAPASDKDETRLREAMLNQFENQSRYEQLEKQVRKAPESTEAQARAYYNAHKELFVEPEKLRMSVILLTVDPSSPKAAWDKTLGEAADLRKRILAGEDFGAVARKHSGDPTAKDGGDMGYLHRGMLPEGVDKIADTLKPGQVSGPVTLLEGVALLKLVERKPAQQRTFSEVKERASELWQREEADRRWQKFVADLRRATPVRVNEALYMPLPKPAAPKAG